jgi:hypothetical protein
MKNSKISEINICPLISIISFLFVFLSLRSSIGQDIIVNLFDLALRRFMISLILVLNQSGLDFAF